MPIVRDYQKERPLHHAQTCSAPYTWRPTYVSKDKSGMIIAREFRCNMHGENFWLAIPNIHPELV